MRTDTQMDASSVNTSSDTAKLEWEDSIPTAGDRLVEAIRATDDGSDRIAAHDVRTAGCDVVREEFNERQRVRAELIQASKAQHLAASAARGEPQELGGATVRNTLPVHPPLGGNK